MFAYQNLVQKLIEFIPHQQLELFLIVLEQLVLLALLVFLVFQVSLALLASQF
jgi:hypothetical protein